jgi:hypothetical protein
MHLLGGTRLAKAPTTVALDAALDAAVNAAVDAALHAAVG